MQQPDAKTLLEKYRNGTCSEAEKALLEQWYLQQEESVSGMSFEKVDAIGHEMWQALPVHDRTRTIQLWPKVAAAAVALFLLTGIGIYFFKARRQAPANGPVYEYVNDIHPGGNKAILTLANGDTILLEDAQKGKLAEQSGLTISKTADGQLTYTVSGQSNIPLSGAWNTIATPMGGQYEVNLPDGSKVWLNAASSLRYPVHFAATERKVELTGEAYFEIAHDQKRPFRVSSTSQTVEVLGTHFNINAYADEPATVTTLLQGSVRVHGTGSAAMIKPGQRSVNSSGSLKIQDADVQEAVAWKNGQTQFSNTDIKAVMRMLSRWYNIEVEYQGTPPTEGFWGSVSRSKNISQVLQVMELTGDVHFKVKERRVVVMP